MSNTVESVGIATGKTAMYGGAATASEQNQRRLSCLMMRAMKPIRPSVS